MKTLVHKQAKIPLNAGLVSMLVLFLFNNNIFGQEKCKAEQYLEALPAGLELKETTPQKYLMTFVYYNKDIYGKFFNKVQVSGEYTRGFEDGTVKWNNVRIAESNQEDGIFPEGSKQEYMENFRYSPSEDMMNASEFNEIPENNPWVFHMKNLVWDMMGFEGFAWGVFDSLKLNQFYSWQNINGKVDLSGEGYFENKDIKMLLAGITKLNGEICAVVQFLAMNNPLEINTEMSGMKMAFKGRSHYWGNVLVSLEDKQIEQAIMFEDVVMKINIPGIQDEISNAIRELTVEKLN
jgi:hypothetical protein